MTHDDDDNYPGVFGPVDDILAGRPVRGTSTSTQDTQGDSYSPSPCFAEADRRVEEIFQGPQGNQDAPSLWPLGVDDLITINHLRWAAEQLRNAAHSSTHGDVCAEPLGIHSRKDIYLRDAGGRSKLDTYRAASSWIDPWFEMIARNPTGYPPSREVRVPKDSPGETRPINDPPEGKRPYCVLDRYAIEDRIEARLAPCQLGGRPDRWLKRVLPVTVQKPGWSPDDYIAFLAQQHVYGGYDHVLQTDLANAFGLLPKKAVIPELRASKLSKKAAEKIWRDARLDAISARTRKRIPYSRVMGVEQGNPLSALLLNLALSPILETLTRKLDIHILAYLDDLYFFCPSRAEAERAFHLFKSIAGQRGFRNIRPLGQAGKKASKIVHVTETQPLVILKQYLVTPTWIGLTEKARGVIEREIKRSRGMRTLNPKMVRELGGLQALTKRGIKETSSLLPRLSPSWERDWERGYRGSSDMGRPIEGEGTNGSSALDTIGRSTYGGRTETPAQCRDWERDSNLSSLSSNTEKKEDSYPLPVDGDSSSSSQVEGGSGFLHSRSRARWGASAPRRTRETHRTAKPQGGGGGNGGSAAGDTSGGRQPGLDGSHDSAASPPPLSVLDRQVADLLRRHQPLRLGETHKDAAADLRKLAEVLGPEATNHDIRVAVGVLLRVVRWSGVAKAIIDRREDWTALPEILGNHRDETYQRVEEKRLPTSGGGAVEIKLRRRRKRKPTKRKRPSVHPAPREAEVVVYRPRRSRDALGVWKVKVRVKGQPVRVIAVEAGPVPAGGIAVSVAEVVSRYPDRLVAVEAVSEVVGLVVPRDLSGDGKPVLDKPALVPLRQAQEILLRGRSWRVVEGGCWLLGINLDRRAFGGGLSTTSKG